jgi:hypothetical protein
MAVAVEYYVLRKAESYEFAWNKISGICRNREVERENPDLGLFRRLYNIARHRLIKSAASSDELDAGDAEDEPDFILDLLESAHRKGVDLRDLEISIFTAKTLQQLNKSVVERIRMAEDQRSKPDVSISVQIDKTPDDINA